MNKILIVEDEIEIANVVKNYLQKNGYKVLWSSTGVEGLEDFKKDTYSLVILDIMLPEMDGFTFCKNLRLLSDVPIIIISAKIEEYDKVKGLKLGADDYITKPFSLVELGARVESHLRRYKNYNETADNILKYSNNLIVDMENKRAVLDDSDINLTIKEFEILYLLCHNPNKIFTKKDIYKVIWGSDDMDENNTVTVHVKELRGKLKDSAKTPKFIKTVWGIGYEFIGERI